MQAYSLTLPVGTQRHHLALARPPLDISPGRWPSGPVLQHAHLGAEGEQGDELLDAELLLNGAPVAVERT
jgi:hypothetical protein